MTPGIRFVVHTLGLSCTTLLLGVLPTKRLGGDGATGSMAAGVAVSLIGSWIGALPIAARRAQASPQSMGSAISASALLRLGSSLALGLSVALSGLVVRSVFLLWMAVSYMILLVADTYFAVTVVSAKRSC